MPSPTEGPLSPESKPDVNAGATRPVTEAPLSSKRKRDLEDKKPNIQEDEMFAAFVARFKDNVKDVDDRLKAKADTPMPDSSHGDDFDKFYAKLRVTDSGLSTDPWTLPSSVKLAEIIAMYLSWLVENPTHVPDSGKIDADMLQGWANTIIERAKFNIIARGHPEAWCGVRRDGSDSLKHLIMRVWAPIVERKLILPRLAQSKNADATNDEPLPKRVRHDGSPVDKGGSKDSCSQTDVLTVDDFWTSIDKAWSTVIANGAPITRVGLLSADATERKVAALLHSVHMEAFEIALKTTLETFSHNNLQQWEKHQRDALANLHTEKLYQVLGANAKTLLDKHEFRDALSFVIATGKAYFEAVKASPEVAVPGMVSLDFSLVGFELRHSRAPPSP